MGDKFDSVRLHQHRQAADAKAAGVGKVIVKIGRHSCGGTAILVTFSSTSGLVVGKELEVVTTSGNSRIDLDKAASVLAEGGWFRPRAQPPNEIHLT